MQRYLLFTCIAAIALLASGLGLASPGIASSGLASEFASQAGATSKLTVQVAGARNSKGQIAIALFQDGAGFPGDKSKAFRTLQVRIDPQTLRAQVTLNGLPPGVYAVSVFHDENMNGQLDKNIFGIPKEGYGASNNPKKSMGPPKFAEAKFQLDQPEKAIEISLLY
ncbi:DUF2141 domain-containing protein [Terriglobus sp. 2YAB30_2]|uniref:DUF2141 domain-containing protein n=1 Tax=unclassified Terriglobus TaxID=2628988 RepID=UPI003F9E69EA